jgi:hypothetical protein
MTPEERNLVIELFDRLGTLEDARRDPDAERVIKEGLRQAPNAVYALVQTTLVQDEALKRADARIKQLEAHAEDAPRDSSFLGGMRQQVGSRGGSVPSVRASAGPGGMSPAWQAAPAAAQPLAAAQPPAAAPPPAAAQPQAAAPATPSGFGGSSFLGTAAAAAAGMIGGSLLLGGIRSMMGGSGGAGGHGALDSLAGGGGSPWAGGGGANSDLARAAGIDDIGRAPAGGDSNRAGLVGSGDAGAGDDSGADADAFLGDADMDLGGGGDD